MARIAHIAQGALALCVVSATALGQVRAGPAPVQGPENRGLLTSVRNEYLLEGSVAILGGRYDEGIRLTKIGLELATSPRHRAAALSNLCAGYAAKNEPDTAIEYCTQSLATNDGNWRAYSNRAYAYYLKRMFDEADKDLDVALSINPDARQMPQIRGMMNERRLRGRVAIEEHQ